MIRNNIQVEIFKSNRFHFYNTWMYSKYNLKQNLLNTLQLFVSKENLTSLIIKKNLKRSSNLILFAFLVSQKTKNLLKVLLQDVASFELKFSYTYVN